MNSEEVDAAFKVLADRERREVLTHLRRVDRVSVDVETEPDRAKSLIHNHLPRLGETGLVGYEVTQGEIEIWRGERFDEICSLLERVEEIDEFNF